MALRDQPYIPLYVQDFLTDEKLIECSASATGVYIRLMCLMHKSDEYGVFLLKQKDKQTSNSIENFALKLVKSMPYHFEVILNGLYELIEENVLVCQDDKLIQKRMVKDNSISTSRSKAGKKGGGNPNFVKTKSLTTIKTKRQTNYEYESEYESEINSYSFSSEFLKAWNELLTMPKWRKKPKSAVNKSLYQLMKFDEKFAIGLIEKAIAGNYQGVVFSNTEDEYFKFKQALNAKTINHHDKLASNRQAAVELAAEVAEKSRKFVEQNQRAGTAFANIEP